MSDPADVSAWIALLVGLYALGAAIGELRAPGSWAKMVDAMADNDAVLFLTGIVCIAAGGAIYLVTPDWAAADWLTIFIKITGGGMVIEGFVMLAFGNVFMRFARRLLASASGLWAWVSAVLGVTLIVIAAMRF